MPSVARSFRLALWMLLFATLSGCRMGQRDCLHPGPTLYQQQRYNERMNVSEEQLQSSVAVLRSMGAKKVLLFGSFADSPSTALDIDLAVEGIPLNRLLDADVAVHDILQVPTDLASKEENPEFFEIIQGFSRTLYDEASTDPTDSV